VLSFLRNILIIFALAFVGFLISSKEYRDDFDKFLRKVKKELETHAVYYLVFITVVSAILRFRRGFFRNISERKLGHYA